MVADTLLNYILRGVYFLFGVGAVLAIVRWIVAATRERREQWAQRIALGMVLLALLYAFGHARLLWDREEIEAGRARYARFGDPRLAELNRAEVRGWILDCSGRDDRALARYAVREGEVSRVYPLGEAGANLVGGGDSAEVRDYTVERVFTSRLRQPLRFAERGELHPAGTDLQLTLCAPATLEASRLLEATGLQGAVVVQDVRNGALLAYAATGTASQAPFGIKRYALPGSVFKLALSAMWWDAGLGDVRMPCPSEIKVSDRAPAIHNFESHEYASLEVPREMLVVSCNTQAIMMGIEMRQRLGSEAFVDGLKKLGFAVYNDQRPRTPLDFWNSGNDQWMRRMSPPPNQVRVLKRYNAFEWAQMSIGQGPVDVTPIGISRFVSAIGNGGVMLPVTMEADRLDEVPEGRRIMKRETSLKLQQAMLEVVQRGTGVRAIPILQGTGWNLGGKTGTADVVRGHVPDGWFAGLMFGPDGRARYSVVVYLRNGGQGGRGAAPLAAQMTRWMAQQAAAEARQAAQDSARKAAPRRERDEGGDSITERRR
ncbi:MAG TPA: penicillin-binding transpeptidase domain-containing protein [Longimicrobium sp.]|nr:penicillin-binding transpeptidase domain-containing protein [Longimicrobium sp.]